MGRPQGCRRRFPPTASCASMGWPPSRPEGLSSGSARAAYQDFLTLWKQADLDISALIAVKAEYAKLK
jgi:hypothetical protein